MSKFLKLLIALCLCGSASAQFLTKTRVPPRPNDEWRDVNIFEQYKLYPRVNVVPYQNEDDIEKLNYHESPHFVSLSGMWKMRSSYEYHDIAEEVENKDFSVDGWKDVNVPSLDYNVNSSVITNALSISKKENTTLTFYKEFDVPNIWEDYRAILQFQARSAYYIWVNHQFVGYSEDSRDYSEFDISIFLKYGEKNFVVIQVISTSDGSLLESNFSRSFVGITSDVSVVLKPVVSVYDFKITSDYDNHTGRFDFDVKAQIDNVKKKGKYYVEVELWGPKGEEVEKMGKWIVFDKRTEISCSIGREFYGLKPWSVEHPSLYTAVIRVRDEEMNLIESVGSRFGFRTVEIDNGLLKVNGSTILLKGVVYADANLKSRSQLEEDLRMMKLNNINAIRTAYYSPASPLFYELCDKYGFYVFCDANIQPFSQKSKAVATDVTYSDLFVARVQDMYDRYKNHPSIIAWSLGPSTDNGICMENAYKALKQKDKSRPVVFGGAQFGDNTDIVALRNANIDVLKQFLVKNHNRPLVLLEYGETHGNTFGGYSDIWQLMREEPQLQGGFIARWNPVAVWLDGEENTLPSLVDDNLQTVPYITEIKNLYRNFDVKLLSISQDAGEFSVANRCDNQKLSDWTLEYIICSNLKNSIIEGEVRMDLSPGEVKNFKLKIPKLTLYAGEELFIRFVVKYRDKTDLVPKGAEMEVFEFLIPMEDVAKQPLPSYGRTPLVVSVSGNENDSRGFLSVSNDHAQILFDLDKGTLASYRFDGVDMIDKPLKLTVFRDPTPNDYVDKNGYVSWKDNASLVREVVDANYHSIDEYTVAVDFMSRYSNSSGATMMDVKQTILVLHSGDVLMENEIVVSDYLRQMPRLGFQTIVGNSLDTVSWYGLNIESYPDRRNGAITTVNSLQLENASYNYSPNQSSGNHADVRWVSFTNDKVGFFVDMVDDCFNFSVSPAEERIAFFDFGHAGIGSSVAGVPISHGTMLRKRNYKFTLHLCAYDVLEYEPHDFRRIEFPKTESSVLPVPVIGCDKDRFNQPMKVNLSCAIPNADIRYTLDGSIPTEKSLLYSKPFTIESTTIVTARAFKKNSTPSFTASKRFDFDYIDAVSFQNAPNTPYNRNADKCLFDGMTASVVDLSSGWLGFSGTNVVASFSLSKSIELGMVELRFAHVPEAWVFAPSAVDVYVSSDGVDFGPATSAVITYDPASRDMNSTQVVKVDVEVNKKNVKYVKLVARNLGKIPVWHKAKGLKPWVMMDEVRLNER